MYFNVNKTQELLCQMMKLADMLEETIKLNLIPEPVEYDCLSTHAQSKLSPLDKTYSGI